MIIDTFVYILFYGLPVYLFLDIHNLPIRQQYCCVLVILLTCLQFVKLEKRIDNLKILFIKKIKNK
jgi:hypothetical protein